MRWPAGCRRRRGQQLGRRARRATCGRQLFDDPQRGGRGGGVRSRRDRGPTLSDASACASVPSGFPAQREGRRYARDVSLLAIHRAARRLRRHDAALLVILALGAAIAAHHSGIAMGDVHHADGVDGAVVLCLGVFAAVGAAVAVVALGMVALGRWRPPTVACAAGLSRVAAAVAPRARGGPTLVSLLCVCRR